jgi:hypothetical protein
VVLMPRRQRGDGDDGLVIVIVALMLTALLACAAMVIDLGYARQSARHEQGAMDAAVLAGARELPKSATPDVVNDPISAAAGRQQAALFAWKSLFEGVAPALPAPTCSGARCVYTTAPFTVTIETPYTLAGSGIDARHLIYAQACRPSPSFLAQSFGGRTPTVCRASVARRVKQSDGTGIGIIALATTGCNIQLNGNNDITVTGGAVISNSSGSPAICSSGAGCGSWVINADLVAAVGTVTCEGNMPGADVVENASPVPDPYAQVPDGPCDAPALVPCTSGVPSTAGVCGSAMSPGRFTSGCDLGGGNGTVTVVPGVYWFEGSFNLRNHDVTCPTCTANNGVLLYFRTGTMDGGGNGQIMTPPYRAHGDASPYAGLSVYQRRTNPTPMIFGGTTGNILGSVYAAGARINMHGNVDRTVNGLIVGLSVDVQGTTTNTVIPPDDGPTTPPIIDIGLQQ